MTVDEKEKLPTGRLGLAIILPAAISYSYMLIFDREAMNRALSPHALVLGFGGVVGIFVGLYLCVSGMQRQSGEREAKVGLIVFLFLVFIYVGVFVAMRYRDMTEWNVKHCLPTTAARNVAIAFSGSREFVILSSSTTLSKTQDINHVRQLSDHSGSRRHQQHGSRSAIPSQHGD